ncbi:MAG: hypothetical protein KKA59_06330, partial [Candidatus Omnitrophica bacterium]|nr:hypothetical protein [Candidatus Omnitrophota bacterium]
KELYDLKQEMVSSKENKDGIDKLEQSKLPQDIIERVKESLEEIQAARELKTTQEEITKIKDALNNNLDKLPKDTKDYLKDRLEFLLDQKNNQFKEALKENNITESNKESLFQLGQNLEKIESTTNENKVERKVNDMLDKLDKAFSQGEITEKARDKLKNYLKEIQGLLEDRLGLEEINDAMKGINKSGVENVIESIPSLTNFQRDALNNLNEELGKADNLTQLEIIMEGVEKEIVSLERVISKEDSDRLKNEFKKVAEARREIIIARATHQLRKSLEELRESNPEDAQEIDGYLKKLDNAKTNIQLQEVIDSIGEYSSKKQEVDKKEVLDKKDESSLFKDIARQINDSLDKFKDTLKENRVDQINKELLQQLENELEKARSAETQDKLKDSLDKILEKTDQAFIQGQINEETKDKLNESLERTQSLAAAKLSLESADVKQKLKSSINADKEKGLSKAAEESKESVSNDPKGKKLPTPDKLANKDTLNIFILPESLILVNGSVTSIKTIAVYSNRLIKEITPEVSWLVVNPKVASINDNGTVYAISVGFTEIYAQYKGLKSKGVMVRVVNKISDDTYSELKKVLKK